MILSTMFTIICFAVMMISINGYVSAMNLMTQPEAGNAVHYGLTLGFNAVGQIIATFGLNNSVDNVAPAILGVGLVFISISIIISLTCGQYSSCCQCNIYGEWCICSQH
jgi:Na+/phosphate symporter